MLIILIIKRQWILNPKPWADPSWPFRKASQRWSYQLPTQANLFLATSKYSTFHTQNITAQLIPSSHLKTVIEQMRQASDAQEYRIQRNILDIEAEAHDHFMEEICYEAHSTGILAEREIFSVKIEADGASIVDDVWWNAEKKMEEIEYFMDWGSDFIFRVVIWLGKIREASKGFQFFAGGSGLKPWYKRAKMMVESSMACA